MWVVSKLEGGVNDSSNKHSNNVQRLIMTSYDDQSEDEMCLATQWIQKHTKHGTVERKLNLDGTDAVFKVANQTRQKKKIQIHNI